MMVSTGEVTNILQNSAEASGLIIDLGKGVADHGHCYAKTASVTVNNLKTMLGVPSGNGGFTSVLVNLEAGTEYYIKAYVSNGKEIVYGKEISFTTAAATLPVITTSGITDITHKAAKGGGNISSDGGAPVTARGVCWSDTPNPTTANNKTADATGTGSFFSSITGLTPNTTYYVRAYAINVAGTAYGNEVSFITAASAVAPPVTTTAITLITTTMASSGGNISNDGGEPVTARGVCWDTTANPTIANSKTSDGTGTGSFTSSLTGLTHGDTYFVRAYATNIVGTGYGNELTFTANSDVPTLTTAAITAVTSNTAESGGDISSDGGSPVTARGVCWSTSANPTIANSATTNGTGIGSFVSNLTGLNPATFYYVRAYATNSAGTAYGNQVSFTTSAFTPTLTTVAITSITATTASSGGNISSDGGALVTARGVCWSTATGPTIADSKTTNGTGTGSFVSSIIGLSSNTTYYLRAYATNSAGTAYGNEVNFKTSAGLPSLTTTEVTSITSNTAVSGGDITNDGGAPVTARGVCWRTTQNPTISDNLTTDGSGTGIFVSSIAGLSPLTTYYVKAYATNSAGTAYGNEVNFTTTGAIPSIPTNMSATPENNQVTVKWNIVSEATGYNLYWSTSPGVSKTSFTGKITNIATNSYPHTGLTIDTTYYYVVTSKNGNGESNESLVAKATVPLLLQNSTISVTGEKDYYQVTVESGKSLFVNINIADPRQNMYLYVKYGSLPTTTDFDAKSETGDDEAISINNTQAGTYFIMVYVSYFYGYSSSGDYTITASTNVNALTFGTNYASSIFHTGEKHYYQVTVSSGQSLFANVSRADSRTKLYLYAKYGSLPTAIVNDASSETGDDNAISITNTQSGTYYIMVYTFYFYGYSASGAYTITSFTSK